MRFVMMMISTLWMLPAYGNELTTTNTPEGLIPADTEIAANHNEYKAVRCYIAGSEGWKIEKEIPLVEGYYNSVVVGTENQTLIGLWVLERSIHNPFTNQDDHVVEVAFWRNSEKNWYNRTSGMMLYAGRAASFNYAVVKGKTLQEMATAFCDIVPQ